MSKFVEFSRTDAGPIRLNAEQSKKFTELIGNPPPPSPALILAMKKGRELMEKMREHEGRNPKAGKPA